MRPTQDGSFTVFSNLYQSTYHSTFGAKTESEWVFIGQGLPQLNRPGEEVYVLEIGFGAGLNAYLTAAFAGKNLVKVHYTAIEKHPLPDALLHEYIRLSAGTPEEEQLWNLLHNLEWNKESTIHPYFNLTKINLDIITGTWPNNHGFDLVYYDAFSPYAQSEMWGRTILAKITALLKTGGSLVTYCVQGEFRRHLKSLGFAVTKSPGPPGKREMLKAIKLS